MKKAFVKTENYARFAAGVAAVERRGAAEAGMMLVHGQPGHGKSTIVYRWAEENGAVFLRANVDWTPRYFLVELAKELRLDSKGTSQQLFGRVLEHVVERQVPIIIDEAEYTLKDKAATLEKIRDISDRAMCTVILIGMGKILDGIATFPQIYSRIAHIVEFSKASLSDVTLTCEKLCEEKVGPDLATEIHKLSKGRMREILNIIANIERLAKDNSFTGEELTRKHFAGIPLSYDWQGKGGKGA